MIVVEVVGKSLLSCALAKVCHFGVCVRIQREEFLDVVD